MVVLIYKRGLDPKTSRELYFVSYKGLCQDYAFVAENGFACEVEEDDAQFLMRENPLMFRIGTKEDMKQVEPAKGKIAVPKKEEAARDRGTEPGESPEDDTDGKALEESEVSQDGADTNKDDPDSAETLEEAIAVVNGMGRHSALDAYATKLDMEPFKDRTNVKAKKEAIIGHMIRLADEAGIQ